MADPGLSRDPAWLGLHPLDPRRRRAPAVTAVDLAAILQRRPWLSDYPQARRDVEDLVAEVRRLRVILAGPR